MKGFWSPWALKYKPHVGLDTAFDFRYKVHTDETAACPSGKGAVCKTVIHRFKSGCRLQVKSKGWVIWLNPFLFSDLMTLGNPRSRAIDDLL